MVKLRNKGVGCVVLIVKMGVGASLSSYNSVIFVMLLLEAVEVEMVLGSSI